MTTCPNCGGYLQINKAKDYGRCIQCNTGVKDPVLSTTTEFTVNRITTVLNGEAVVFNSLEECPPELRELYENEDQLRELVKNPELKVMKFDGQINQGKIEYLIDGEIYHEFSQLPEVTKPYFRLRNRQNTLYDELGQMGFQKLHREVIDHRKRSVAARLVHYQGGVTPNSVSDSVIDKYREEYERSPKDIMDFYYCQSCRRTAAPKSSFFGGIKCEKCGSPIIRLNFNGNKIVLSRR
ncbi:MAG: hypothetical protein KAJ33_07815 [Thermoplasmata archaeon]|nr:hypothetical protein [Thermoplasmata archaeon]